MARPLTRSGRGLGPTALLCVDGKTLRGIHGEQLPGVHLVSVYAAQAGAVLAQRPGGTRAPGKGQELEATKAALAQAPRWRPQGDRDRVVVGDALQTQREVCAQIVAQGGDFLLPVKENQPALRADLAHAFSPPRR